MKPAQKYQILIVLMDIVSFVLDCLIWYFGGFDALLISHACIDFAGIVFNSLVHSLWTDYDREREYLLARLSQIVSLGICICSTVLTTIRYDSGVISVYLLVKNVHYMIKVFPLFEYISMKFYIV